ncbi:hypothetical protein [uncultured Ruminococcus sp.]|uniref:hypothetical protein n=1 Tax=uncultured Ruminococcus sp. TaxID=165186 RepID=UPI0025D3E8F2|nr:hypothetical protein [uncultured Ruminococcus sp.]
MIIFNKEKYEGIAAEDNAGIVGENLVSKVEFTVNGFVGKNTIAAIHLRFKDGSVNTVAPQTVKTVNNSTYIMWKIGKNDIFCHGWVEVQLELREEETTLQTDIVRLFAGESIPIEDKGFTNPNSETLALRDEAKKCWDKIAEQNKQIENNIKVIADSDITLKEEKANKVTVKADVTEESYPSVAYLENYYYDYDDVDDKIQNLKSSVDTKLNLKADKADTLAGYGITDAYDKTYINRSLNLKLDKRPFDAVPTVNSPNYVTSGTVYNSVNSLRQTVVQNKADIEKSLANKYDAANNEIGSGELSPAQTIYEGSEGNFVYAKNGDAVTVSVNITSMLADKNYLQMSGLPFPSKAESRLASIAVYSTKNNLRNVRIDGSWIYISAPSDKFVEDEKMNFVVTYIIRR